MSDDITKTAESIMALDSRAERERRNRIETARWYALEEAARFIARYTKGEGTERILEKIQAALDGKV